MKNSIILFLSLLLVSCGYVTPEEDKYPDLPEFPSHTNSKIKIVPFDRNFSNLMGNSEYFIGNEKGIVVLTKAFNIVKEIPNEIYSSYWCDRKGNVYTVKDVGDYLFGLESAYKYSEPQFKKTKLEIIELDRRKIIINRKEVVSAHHLVLNQENKDLYIDSIVDYLHNEKMNFNLEKILANYSCILKMNNFVYLVKTVEKEFILNTNSFEGFDYVQCEPMNPLHELLIDPNSFDKIVLSNHWGGNHFVGGYYTKGYNYIAMTLGSDTFKFKASNINGQNGVDVLYESEDIKVVKKGLELFWITN